MRDIPDAPWIGMCREDWEDTIYGKHSEEDDEDEDTCD